MLQHITSRLLGFGYSCLFQIFPLALLTLLALRSTPCFAWGPEGHEIVARIAALHLTPKAQHEIDGLLSAQYNNGHDLKLWYGNVANWPDYIRKDRSETGPWHFVDIPYRAKKYDEARDCKAHEGCVVESIGRFRKVLADPQAAHSNRVEALKFLVHFVGDIHQPLHCAERNGDHGGNLCMVDFPGHNETVKLHYVWDGLLIHRSLSDNHLDAVAYAEHLNSRISKKNEQAWAGGSPADWATESHTIAVKSAYGGIPIKETAVQLSENYVKKNRAVVDKQLMEAGIRLSGLLNEIFK